MIELEWIKLTPRNYSQYQDEKVIAIDGNRGYIEGYLYEAIDGTFSCESTPDNTTLDNIEYIIPHRFVKEELIRVVPYKIMLKSKVQSALELLECIHRSYDTSPLADTITGLGALNTSIRILIENLEQAKRGV
jgi:hypothetical protein